MNNLKPLEIANKIIELSGINIFEDSRKKNIVEMRSLLIYILREKLGMRWVNIALFLKSNNKPVNHATLIHSVKNFEMYKKDNKQIQEIYNIFSFRSNLGVDEIDRIHYLENKCSTLQKKLENPLVKLVIEVPNDRDKIESIERVVKSWKWKEKVL
jgi:NADH:ubiquinone oxidoreductase subunit C|tara:strand:+ start:413 stop:880 length:468 start_codon:yes stop_codon:yes gene_type:complete